MQVKETTKYWTNQLKWFSWCSHHLLFVDIFLEVLVILIGLYHFMIY
jgi:hypothetical protein